MKYSILKLNDYDKKIKLNGEVYFGYSEKTLEKHYPNNDYNIIGEVKRNSKKKKIGELVTGEIVSKLDSHSRVLNRKKCYLCVGQDNYIVVLRSRLLLFLLLGLLLAGLLVLPRLGAWLTPESDITPIDNDKTEKVKVAEGDGSLTMIWTLDAEVDLNKGKVDVYFKNPNASTHDVEVELYIISEGKEVLVARSGRVKAGYQLNSMDLVKSVHLKEGMYTGLYRIIGYDSETGKQSTYTPQIPNVSIKAQR